MLVRAYRGHLSQPQTALIAPKAQYGRWTHAYRRPELGQASRSLPLRIFRGGVLLQLTLLWQADQLSGSYLHASIGTTSDVAWRY